MEIRVLSVNAPITNVDAGRFKLRVVGKFKDVPPVVEADVIVYKDVNVPKIYKSVEWKGDGLDYLRVIRRFVGEFKIMGISVVKDTVLEAAAKIEDGRVLSANEDEILSSLERALLSAAGMLTKYLFLKTPKVFIARGVSNLIDRLCEVFIYGKGVVDYPQFFIWLANDLARFLAPITVTASRIESALNIALRQTIGLTEIPFLERMI